jgi:DNA-binding MarR family transcriptional regulator
MASEQSEKIEAVIQAHRQLFRAIARAVPPVWMELDLSMAQLKVLMGLYHNGALSIGQIAELCSIGQPTASHLVDRLVQAQLVQRTEDPLDRRRALAQLAPSGRELAERIIQVRVGPLRRWMAQLDDADLAAFSRISRLLAEIAAAESSNPPETA